MSEATLPEPTADSTAAAAASAQDAVDGLPVCEKCGYATAAAACPKCGWYPSVGVFVEIDEKFEAVVTAQEGGGDGESEAAEPAPTTSEWAQHVEVWKSAIPGWGWLLLATTGGVVAAAIAARVGVTQAPQWHTAVGLGGLLVGLVVALAAHVTAFIFASSEDADLGVADLLIKPFKAWKALLAELPQRVWLTNTMNVGLTTALGAALIVGGIPYERLLDWGYKPRAKQTLVAMIAEQAANGPGSGAKNLEDAVGDFAGKAGAVEGGKKPEPKAEKPRTNLECLVIGYQTNKDGGLEKLLLAADSRGKLKYVGAVKPKLSEEEAAALLARFAASHAARPLVKATDSGVWLRPRFMVSATYTEWPEGRRPRDLTWGAMMDEVKMPW
ncbi:MAG: hypothetical protein AAF805_01215 [Planctomycetota bacterium]